MSRTTPHETIRSLGINSLSFKLNIRGRLIAGFAVVALVLVAAVGITLFQVSRIDKQTTRIVELRVPTAQASALMINNINASLASLRGWMITGNGDFKTERAAVWTSIDEVRANMDRLSATWTNPDNVKQWADFKIILDEFRIAQQKVEDIANTADEQPANKMLLTEAAPRAAIVVGAITAMIDAEAKLEATPERKALLGMMADVRGTMGLPLANIRAFLLTGDKKFQENFDGLWKKNVRRFADLTTNKHLLTAAQRAEFDKLTSARAEFAGFPPKMFEIRGSKKWNMANFLLMTEAAPRAGKLMTTLAGAKQQDGSRAGGMVDNQKALLDADAESVAGKVSALTILEWILLAVGLVIAVVAVLLTARSIVDPLKAMIASMARLADGDNAVKIPSLDKTDEIGEMAKTVQVFKENAIEKLRLEEEEKKAAVERQRLEEDARQKEEEARKTEVEREAEAKRIEEERAAETKRVEEERAAETKKMEEEQAAASRRLEEERAADERALEEKERQAEAERQAEQKRLDDEQRIRDAKEMAEQEARQQRIDALTDAFGESVTAVLKSVSASAEEMERIAETLNMSAQQATGESAAVASASEQATSNVQTVAVSAEELTASIREISGQIARSAKIAKVAVEAAESTNETIQVLSDSAQQIGDVVTMINDIAEQTNLLALNATIEAARAGEAGKGFAVVASEVKGLASQTAKATDQIAKQIGSVRESTEKAVGAIDGIGKTIAEMDEITIGVSAAMEQQSAATAEISRNVQEAATGTQSVTDSISKVLTASQETGNASDQVLDSAKNLATQFDTLRSTVQEFLTEIKAA